MRPYSLVLALAATLGLVQQTLLVEAFQTLGNHDLSQSATSTGRTIITTPLFSTTTIPERISSRPSRSGELADKELEIPMPPAPSTATTTTLQLEELPLIQIALAGSLTTFLADLSMHPIDCIKTIQQSDLGMSWSISQSAHYLYDAQGVAGFFRGFLTYATCDALGGCLKFGVWETWKKKLGDRELGWLLLVSGASFLFSNISRLLRLNSR